MSAPRLSWVLREIVTSSRRTTFFVSCEEVQEEELGDCCPDITNGTIKWSVDERGRTDVVTKLEEKFSQLRLE